MNKLGLLFCFLLAISYVQSEEIDGLNVTDLYDKLISVTKGMAETNEYKCSNNLRNNRNTIMQQLKQ